MKFSITTGGNAADNNKWINLKNLSMIKHGNKLFVYATGLNYANKANNSDKYWFIGFLIFAPIFV